MGLTARQGRALKSMEERLRAREPRLVSMFSLFTRLNQDESIPVTETITIGRWRYLTGGLRMRTGRRPRATGLIGMAVAPFVLVSLVATVLALGGLFARHSLCTATAIHYSASQIDFPQRNCPARP